MWGSPSDWAVIIIVALILFFGTSKIPELFRSMGRALGEFKKGRLEAEMEMQQMQQPSAVVAQQGDKVAELQKQIEELQKQLEQQKKQETQTQKQQ
jgi:twin arginine-targeting protein translocase, TatA/E family